MEIPTSFIKLPMTLPPMLLAAARVTSEVRFIGLLYQAAKATWTDGRSSATFSFYGVYQPFMEHIVNALFLAPYNFGSDDFPGTEVLICDREAAALYAAPNSEGQHFLLDQHPPVANLSAEEMAALLSSLPDPSMDDCRELGMFEFLFGPTPEQRQDGALLVRWLDTQISEPLLRVYIDRAKAGDATAAFHLSRFSTKMREYIRGKQPGASERPDL